MNKEVVKELIQDELNTENLKRALEKLLNDAETKKQLQEDYQALKKLLGGKGAAKRAAEIIVNG